MDLVLMDIWFLAWVNKVSCCYSAVAVQAVGHSREARYGALRVAAAAPPASVGVQLGPGVLSFAHTTNGSNFVIACVNTYVVLILLKLNPRIPIMAYITQRNAAQEK